MKLKKHTESNSVLEIWDVVDIFKKQCLCIYVVYQLFVYQQIRVFCIYIQLCVVLHNVQLILLAVSYYLHIYKIKRFGIFIYPDR
jgi:hypothetical protein